MSKNNNNNSETFNDVLGYNDEVIVRYSIYILCFLSLPYGIFWYIQGEIFFGSFCFLIFFLSAICLYFNKHTTNYFAIKSCLLFIAMSFCFTINALYFNCFQIIMAYYSVIPVVSFLINEATMKVSLFWVVFTFLSAIVSTLLSTYYFDYKVFDSNLIYYFSIIQGITLIIISVSLIYIYNRNTKKYIEKLSERNVLINESRRELKEIQKYKDDFFTSMNHELRTPMNAIKGISEILIDKNDTKPEIENYYQSLNNSSNHLLEIINDLLDLSKINDEKLVINNDFFRLRESINESLNMLKFSIQEKGLNFEYEIDKDLPNFYTGDILRIKQVLVNLLSNAIKFTENGFVKLNISLENENESKFLKFCIEDTGIGIDEEVQDEIFSKFYQINNEFMKGRGSGLGLNISKKLVGLLNGNMWFKSKKDIGTKFYFTVLVEEVSEIQEKEKDEDVLSFFKKIEKYKILLVDDDKLNLLVAENLLKQSIPNIEIYKKENGQDAVDFVSNHEDIDMVLMDIQMIGISGLEATKRIREDEKNKNVKIIALTASYCTQEAVEKFKEVGMVDYMTKPFNKMTLLKKLKKYY